MNPKLFPTILIVLDVAAATVYGLHNDWARVGYWISAACITFFTLLM